MNTIVTTINKPTSELEQQAENVASILNVPYIKKENSSLIAIKNQYSADTILVLTKNGPVVHTAGGEYFYHPSLAVLRIDKLKTGGNDHMVEAMQLNKGMSVLDCTLGLGSDAAVASYVVGNTGQVIGLENSPILAFIAEQGMQNYYQDPDFAAIVRRIQVLNTDYNEYLRQLPDQSFDVVYFDPMFSYPVNSSSNMKPIRFLADPHPLSKTALHEAQRVGRRVVIKDARRGLLFSEYGLKQIVGGKYSSICYGVLK